LRSATSPLGFHLNGSCEVALGHRGCHFGDGAYLVGEVVGQQVHVAGEIFPSAGRARHVRLAAKSAFHADFARHRSHLIGERGQRAGHVVDGFREGRDFAPWHSPSAFA